MRLDPAAEQAGYRVLVHDTLDSTNAEALRIAQALGQAPDGETNLLWVVARQQTAGRGRRHRTWISPPGNLYATLLLRNPAPPQRAPELSFVAGLAVVDAIIDRAPELRKKLGLKWPNDVLCADGKLGGILIEGYGIDREVTVAIGIGVNCRHHPLELPFQATDLAMEGIAVAAEDVFCSLSGAMVRRLAQWRGGEGFLAIRSDWIERAAGIGGEVRVRLPDRELSGCYEALDEQGRLLLRLADGRLETIAAGDVFPVSGGEAPRRFAGS